jgi:hypothetical protein
LRHFSQPKVRSNHSIFHPKLNYERFADSSISPPNTSYGSISDDEGSTDEPLLHYGVVSDKIGEACACWLARWGTDILVYEMRDDEMQESGTSTPVLSRKRAKTIPPDFSPGDFSSGGPSKGRGSIPLIWSRGGLNAKWVAAIISADTFFVKGEQERYAFARSVVELRRKEGIIEAEELEWTRLFEHGIFYANMVRLKPLLDIKISPKPT